MAEDPSKPVIEVPGETPTSPSMRLPVPAAVAADPPTTAKVCAAPSDWANPADGTRRSAATPAKAPIRGRFATRRSRISKARSILP
ncbi:MAG TPA: hypothetical protein VFD92_13860 [Candidatus Binatia bacterium]|nr:hypothetical protein [Candidatus Binatia bacterium]